MTAPPKTKRSTPRLSEIAQHVVAPKGVVSTGWPAVEKKAAELGIAFRPWQPDVGRLILAKRADGTYAATIGGTGLSIPRQVGKTFLVGAIVFALCLLNPNLTVIWTAHRLRTAEETFGKMQKFARRRQIAPHILKTVLGSGEEAVLFRNGSRILFGARESGFGLGFDEVDVLIFDEAQRLKESTLDDMIPATNQSRQATSALLLFMGTPPRPTDAGEVFTLMRTDALSGEDGDTGWVEFGCDPDFTPTMKPAPLTERDWKQVARANPSYPHDTPRAAILRMRKKLGDDSFIREGLGRWDEGGSGGAIDANVWKSLRQELPMPDRVPAIGIAGSPDGLYGAIGAAAMLDDGRLAVAPVDIRRGQRWLVDKAKRIQDEQQCAVVVFGKGPLSYLIQDLEDAGVALTITETSDWVDASEDLWRQVQDGTIVHPGDPDLTKHALAASWRKVGDRRAFDLKAGIPLLESVAWAARAVDADYDPLDSIL